MLAVGVVVGLAGAYVAFGRSDPAASPQLRRDQSDVAVPDPSTEAVPAAGAAAADQVGAVEAFLTAEVDADFERSWNLLVRRGPRPLRIGRRVGRRA